MPTFPKITLRSNSRLLLLLVLICGCKEAPKIITQPTAAHVHDTVYLTKEKTSTAAPVISNGKAVVSADAMNILYVGTINPVSVAIPGAASNQIQIAVANGTYTGLNGHYEVKVNTVGITRVTAFTKTATGQRQNVSTTTFRTKFIPNPKVKFAGQNGGTCRCVNLKCQIGIFAQLDNYGIDAKFGIEKFTLVIAKPAHEAIVLSTEGYELTSEMKTALQTITPGTLLIFKDVIAVGPDGNKRPLEPIVFTAN